MIAIVNYGVGNLFSLRSSLGCCGSDGVVTSDPDIIRQADKIILPGVGAFADAAEKLTRTGLDAVVKEQCADGKPLLGICLGMQLLFEKSYEYGVHSGLGLIPGEIVPLKECVPDGLKIPHMGWNSLSFRNPTRLYSGVSDGEYVYFVHSYFAETDAGYVTAVTDYGAEITASVARGNVLGTQFHPEKSGESGLKILKAFCKGDFTC
ncbi:MAG: imidazole glycerol phosphate synthase subunit HisH [Clostridia bacterium]|nr:imidazole glycerol phosphate synthase subunit HisH [Clostridia bacterium]